MKLVMYLKEKTLVIFLLILLDLLVTFILYALKCNAFIIFDIVFLITLAALVSLGYDYLKRRKFYEKLLSILQQIDNKSLVHEMIESPGFFEGDILLNILYETDKYKIEEINKYKFRETDFKEFIEMWVHEIKTPLSSALLTLYNNPSKLSDEVKNELDKAVDYVEQILFYARSEAVEKDYMIKKITLESVVNKVILRHKHDILLKKISLDIHDLDVKVNTDTKWLEFIINQIINNSIKYTEENPTIKIYAKTSKEATHLYIEDNGIGIESSDLPRVFDKGFTGENGRKEYNSTGLGLYLVKKLCNKMDHEVSISSFEGTTVIITFPIGSYTEAINLTEM